jgi:hypothetical protein
MVGPGIRALAAHRTAAAAAAIRTAELPGDLVVAAVEVHTEPAALAALAAEVAAARIKQQAVQADSVAVAAAQAQRQAVAASARAAAEVELARAAAVLDSAARFSTTAAP